VKVVAGGGGREAREMARSIEISAGDVIGQRQAHFCIIFVEPRRISVSN
jgi:hypothetical protein